MIFSPPLPPIEENFIPGIFNYIKNKTDRIMLQSAYKAITVTENWEFIKNVTDFYLDDEINKIYKKIEELGYYGHSGCSFICTMNKMRFIANYGEEKFKEKITEK